MLKSTGILAVDVMNNKTFRAFDVLGNIAIVKFPDRISAKEKKKFALEILKKNKSIKTILEKTRKFKGRLRKQETKYVAGEKTKEALYKENGCVFRFNIDKAYFSSRLANERKEIAGEIKRGDIILVMFAGVAPFPIVIAKNSQAKKVYSNEINREANKYAELNIRLNNVKDRVFLLPGDIKRIAGKLKEKIDVIVMPRPQLKETFLKGAFILSKTGTRIYYYDFVKLGEINSVAEKIKKEAEKFGKKIKVMKIKRAGEIGMRKFRIRVDFRVL